MRVGTGTIAIAPFPVPLMPLFLLIALLFAGVAPLHAQTPQSISLHPTERKTMRAVRTAGTMRLDGMLDEDEWTKAEPATGFIQTAQQFYWMRFLLGVAEAEFVPARQQEREAAAGVAADLRTAEEQHGVIEQGAFARLDEIGRAHV